MHPTHSEVHIDQALTSFSLAYANQEYIADEVLPVITVPKKSDKYFTYGLENRDLVNDIHSPGANFRRVQHARSSDSFSCDDRGTEHALDKATLEDDDLGADAQRQGATNLVTDLTLLHREYRVSAAVLGAGWTQSTALSGANRWDNPDSDPVAQIQTDRDAVIARGAQNPNRLMIGYPVLSALLRHPKLVKAPENVGRVVTLEWIAQLFGVERIVVGRAVYNTAKQGQATSCSSLWGKNALLYYFPPAAPGLMTPLHGAQFCWMGRTGGQRQQIERYDEPQTDSEIIRIRNFQDEKICAVAFASLRTTVID